MPGHFSDEFDGLEKVIKTTGQVVGSGIQTADTFIDNNIPGGERWTRGVSNITQGIAGAANEFTEITDRAATDPIQSPGDAGLFLIGSFRKGVQDTKYLTRAAAEAAGFDPRLGNAATFILEEIATLGAGKFGKTISKLPPPSAPKLVPAFAAVRQQTQAKYFGSAIPKGGQVSNITVSPKFRAPGVTEGVGHTDLFKPAVQKLRSLEKAGIDKRTKYANQLSTGVISQEQYKKRLAKLKKTEDANYSTLGTVEDPDIYEVSSQVNRDPIDPNLPAHQHHAAGKAMTTPWVKKALQLGDDDDVVALFEFHKLLTGSGMGNAKSGIIDMPGFSHIARDARTPADVPMAVHSFMQKGGADIQILTTKVEKILGDPKNMDELLEKYSTFAAEYLIPQKELSLKRLTQVLTEHRNTLSPKQAKVFDTLVSKLNKANT